MIPLFRPLFWDCSVGLCVSALDGAILQANPAYCEITGYELDQLRGRQRLELVHPEDQPRLVAAIAEAQQGGSPKFAIMKRYVRPDGGWRWVKSSCSLSTAEIEGGKLPVLISITEDVTAQYAAEQELRLLSAAVANAHESVLITDAQLNAPGPYIRFVNEAFTGLTGYTAAEVIGRNPRFLQGPETDRTVLARLRQTLEAGEHFSGETVNYRKDGAPYMVAWSISPIHGPDGTITHFVAVQNDVTQLRQIEGDQRVISDSLRSREWELREAQRMAGVGSWRWEMSTDTVTWSPELYRISGIDPSKRAPSYAEHVKLYSPASWELLRTAVEKAVAEGEAYEIDLEMIRADGTRIWTVGRGELEFDQHGKMVGLHGTLQDVSQRKATELALREAKEIAEAGAQAKADFLATMSHEIRTPMNGILGFANLLVDTPLDPDQKEFVDTIRHSGEALLAIINDLLDFSKIEAGKLTLESIPADVHLIAIEVCELLSPKLAATEVELVLDWPPEVPQILLGDPGRIRQVLLNLLSNAIKFTRQGHIIVRGVEGPGETLRIEVTDSGIGIPPEKHSLLFGKFNQADSSTTRNFGGTGLGLAICRQLVEAMQGEIGFTSAPGVGSTFWFTLPAAPVTGLELGATAAAPATRLRVLIVDDFPINRRLLEAQLDRWQLPHASAASATEALAHLHQALTENEPFDVALLDHCLPEINGEQLADAIRADESLRSTGLVLLTSANATREETKRLLAHGFSDVLQKPIVRSGQLLSALERAGQHTEPHPCNQTPLPRYLATPTQPFAPLHRVLLAEDNPVNQRLAIRLLEKAGCQVDLASDGLVAVDMACSFAYDLIFMDCQMPKLDGFEAAATIRRTQSKPPIIALTANAVMGDRERCMEAGMDDYLSKPIRLTQLEEAIRRWIA